MIEPAQEIKDLKAGLFIVVAFAILLLFTTFFTAQQQRSCVQAIKHGATLEVLSAVCQ